MTGQVASDNATCAQHGCSSNGSSHSHQMTIVKGTSILSSEHNFIVENFYVLSFYSWLQIVCSPLLSLFFTHSLRSIAIAVPCRAIKRRPKLSMCVRKWQKNPTNEWNEMKRKRYKKKRTIPSTIENDKRNPPCNTAWKMIGSLEVSDSCAFFDIRSSFNFFLFRYCFCYRMICIHPRARSLTHTFACHGDGSQKHTKHERMLIGAEKQCDNNRSEKS